jgi:hypothetical protein
MQQNTRWHSVMWFMKGKIWCQCIRWLPGLHSTVLYRLSLVISANIIKHIYQ